MPRKKVLLASLAFMCALASGAWAFYPSKTKHALFSETTGYRIANMRSATPPSIDGGRVITLDELELLVTKEKPVLIDVMVPDNALSHRIKNRGAAPAARYNIPGSHWLPLLGQSELVKPVEDAQISAIKALAANDMNHPIVIYCKAECWTSWNAARRTIKAEFKRVYWFREGTDIWEDAGLPLHPAKQQ